MTNNNNAELDKRLQQLGERLKEIIDGKSSEEKAKIWWGWHGDRLVETLKQLSNDGVSLIEAMAFAGGQLREVETGWLIEKAFAGELAEQATKDPDVYDLALKICAVNLDANGDIPKPLRTVGASALLQHIKRPSKRGRSRTANRERDLLVLRSLLVAKQYGLPISRGFQSGSICAAKLVCEAFEKAGQSMLTEAAIAKIWKDRKKSGLLNEAKKLSDASMLFQLGTEESATYVS